MRKDELESRVQTLESQVKALQTLIDIEEIKKLQRAYGYYLQRWMANEIVDLFSDAPDVALEFPSAEGTYLGKEGVKRYYENRFKGGPEFMHQLMQLSPIIDVDVDGNTARGRWYGFGAVSTPRGGGVGQMYMNGTYENEYVKEDGKWKIKRLSYATNWGAKPGEGWVKPERVAAIDPNYTIVIPEPDIPRNPEERPPAFPSGYIFPFHFKHPVTGKITTEKQLNKSLPGHPGS
jgi:hypothetical protein